MQETQENATSAIVNDIESDCATGLFVVFMLYAYRPKRITATHPRQPYPRRADSESRFLAMKKFSWLKPSRLIDARQKRFFERIAAA